jgi:predicted Zn finger-like uncharacterized protein
MIITCDECSTSFRLDESLLRAEGSKVRCSLCKHVFTAFPPVPDDDFSLDLESMPESADSHLDTAAKTHLEPHGMASGDLESGTLDFDDTDFGDDLSLDAKQADIEISFEDNDDDFDLDADLSFETEEETQESPLEFDEAEIEFDSRDLEPLEDAEPLEDMKMVQDPHADGLEDTEELDGIAFDDLISEPGQEKTDAGQTGISDQGMESTEHISMDMDQEKEPEEDLESRDLDFELEKNFSAYDEVLDQETEPEEGSDDDTSKEDTPDEQDFGPGDDFDVRVYDKEDPDDKDMEISDKDEHEHPSEKPPPQRPARAPLIQPLDTEAEMGKPARKTRKKTRSSLSAPVLVLLLIFLLTAGGYVAATSLGYKIPFLSEIKIPFIQQYLPQKTPEPMPAPDPIPDQKTVNGRFVTNDAAGELFIITGNIENPSQIPYTRIQVQGTLFQKEKIAAMTQTAYCGTIVSEEVLKTGNVADIIARLKNPPDTGAANVTAGPGNTVPFMLVFSDLPKNLQNFTVEVLGFEKAEN